MFPTDFLETAIGEIVAPSDDLFGTHHCTGPDAFRATACEGKPVTVSDFTPIGQNPVSRSPIQEIIGPYTPDIRFSWTMIETKRTFPYG